MLCRLSIVVAAGDPKFCFGITFLFASSESLGDVASLVDWLRAGAIWCASTTCSKNALVHFSVSSEFSTLIFTLYVYLTFNKC